MSERTFTVGELAETIAKAVRAAFPRQVWIQGAIQSLRRHPNGHVYFQLVDPGELGRHVDAAIDVALLAPQRRDVNAVLKRSGGVRMDNGIEIRIRGTVDLWARAGKVQVRMTGIDPEFTLGRLAADRERLLAALAADGLLDANRSRPLGPAPLRIAVITSAHSAAERDVLGELEASGFGFEVTCIDTRVQGADAGPSMLAALETAQMLGVELIALVRGGGARTDLAAFDDEGLARAIAASTVPVWTGIGHEIDESVADRVAHTSYKTPTACAAGLVHRARDHLGRVDDGERRLVQRASAILGEATAGLDATARRLARETDGALALADQRITAAATRLGREAAVATREAEAHLDRSARRLGRDALRGGDRAGLVLSDRAERLARAAPRPLLDAERELDALATRVAALDPARALARGWSITRDDRGRVLRRPDEAPEGTALITTLEGGLLHSTARTPPGERPADDDG
ncbi:MAG: exodeoxyribonuclease VII large subunit [Actinomycetota bacterium]|nr:exodeoxyribonuclease VII large subunit [Actinomycetota bacterium]